VCGIIEESNIVTDVEIGTMQAWMQPEGSDLTTMVSGIPFVGGAVSIITAVWSYIKPLVQAIFLYFPDLWNGTWLWFYYIFILPISIGFVVSIVFILRGVANS
jgi:hypothetical protein